MDPYQFSSYSSYSWPSDFPETPTVSDATNHRVSHSDEEQNLASQNPKKRAGRTKFKETRHPVYRGVRRRNLNKWVSELREPNKKTRIWLGTYPTAEMAARAHDVAVMALRGRMAVLNFADSAWRLSVPATKDAQDIRKAAAEAAEAFRSVDCAEDSGGSDGGEGSPAESNFSGCEGTFSQTVGVEVTESSQNVGYVDEEEVFNMPGLLADMAEGLMVDPPNVGPGYEWEDIDSSGDVSLWNY